MRQSRSQTYTGSFCFCPTVCLITCAECRRSDFIQLPISPRSPHGHQSVCVLPLLGTDCKISLWSIKSSSQQHLQGQGRHCCFSLVPNPLLCKSRNQSSCRPSEQAVLQMGDMYLCVALLQSGLHLPFTARFNIRRFFFCSNIDCF